MESEMRKQEDNDIQQFILNLPELQENVKMAGFGDYFNEELAREVLSGKELFALSQSLQIDKDKMDYKMDIRIDKVKKKGYLNDMYAILIEESGEMRSQQFPRFLRITAKEAYNLLKWGISSGVEKSLFNREGVKYRSFITLDITSEKDLYGSYPLLQYHENYYREPFTIQGELRKLPVEIREAKEDVERLIASLKRGNMTAVTAVVGGVEQSAFLSVNAKAGRLDLRGANLELMDPAHFGAG
ncbi:hypothetical protein SAMN05192529_10960 [Arachidicoccus rhizosphaerae]|uniref:Uncharacterized protein n=1 Tax=Arachidicoccus rhizosphaerae TaxID=551991 RepID=A0A1H3YUR2_9BACT|nr:hypothetical protein [Arachidicoccus rhizosphaerae]SEA15150.1 hypothetical protein SAMN05192529_10960 [Arachidicoccus rhizosphaerae]